MMRNTVKKILCVAAAAVAAASVFCGCSGEKPSGGGDKTQTQETLVSRICTLDSGKTYLEVDGKPFAIRGAQVRVDGLLNRNPDFKGAIPSLTDAQLEEYFKKAKELGLNTLECVLEWSKVETSKDVYDFTLADKLLSFANKYDLKIEFLWFSVLFVGTANEYFLPDYIYNDKETYPRIVEENEWSKWNNCYGYADYFELDNEKLMERERIAVEKLMEHVYEWNIANGEKNPLIGVQCHNESDNTVRWKYFQRDDIKLDGIRLTQKQIWDMTLATLNNLGKAFKSSKYKIYTRANITTSYGVGEYLQCENTGISPMDIFNLEGIDIIGDDPYTTNPSTINSDIREYSFAGNYPHIAENMGDYESSPSLFLTTYQAGGSYMFYELATSPYWIQVIDSKGYHIDQGLLNPDLSYKAHTKATSDIVKGVAAMGSVLPLVESSDFACFNIMTETPANTFSQTVNTSNLSFTFKTQEGGIAYAIERDGYAYLYATADCNITVNNADYTLKADIGAFDKDVFEVAESKVINPDGIRLEANKLHRIKIRKINENVTSTADVNV